MKANVRNEHERDSNYQERLKGNATGDTNTSSPCTHVIIDTFLVII